MSLLTQQTSVNTIETYFVRATGKTLNVSSLNANSISTNTLAAESISTTYLSAYEGVFSTFSTAQIDLDGQLLTADANDLLLNGIPVATLSSLSSIADWAIEPAISTVDMAGNNIIGASTISCQTIVANNGIVAANLQVGNGIFNNLVAFNSLFVSSNTSTISSLAEFADLGVFSTISTGYLEAATANISTLTSQSISTPALQVSSINGAEFTSTQITVEVGSFSSLVANSVSSVGAAIREALISTIVFSPSLNPSLGGVNVNLGLGGILGNVIGWGAGVLGAATGIVALGTSAFALASGRQTNYIDNSRYELVNGATQLQFSTLGVPFSTIYRFNNSADPERTPGEEVFISTVNPPGVAVRSVSDPINTLSSPSSTIQAFGQWVPVPDELVNVSSFSTIFVSEIKQLTGAGINMTGSTISIEAVDASLTSGDASVGVIVNGLTSTVSIAAASSIQLFPGLGVPGHVEVQGALDVVGSASATARMVPSTLSTATIEAANANLFGLGIQGMTIQTAAGGQLFISTSQTNIQGLINASSLGAFNVAARNGGISSLGVSSLTASTLTLAGLSSIVFSTSGTAGAQSQPAGRLIVSGNDLDVGQQDIWAQQIRLGAGNATNAQTEIIFYDAAANQRGLQTALQDRTVRVVSTINANQGGYLLDTSINPPFFSTINNTSTALMAFFPSSINSTIGVSTLSYIPVSFQATSGFSGTLLYPNISSSAVAANIVASTTIQTNAAGSYVIAQANTSFQNQTNQYHDIYLNLAIDGVLSPSTFTSLPAGLNHYANGSIAYRQAVSSGTHTIVLYASADANGVAVGTQTDIWGTGNLAP